MLRLGPSISELSCMHAYNSHNFVGVPEQALGLVVREIKKGVDSLYSGIIDYYQGLIDS